MAPDTHGRLSLERMIIDRYRVVLWLTWPVLLGTALMAVYGAHSVRLAGLAVGAFTLCAQVVISVGVLLTRARRRRFYADERLSFHEHEALKGESLRTAWPHEVKYERGPDGVHWEARTMSGYRSKRGV